jgi:hypothetical protein
MTQVPKKKPAIYKNDNILEALGGMGGSVVTTTTQEAAKIGTDVLTSLFGALPSSGELKPNQSFEFSPAPKEEAAPQAAPRVEHMQERDINALTVETARQIEAVRVELKALAASLKGLHQEIQTSIEQQPVNPGIYHKNFYERLRSFLMILRVQIEDSRTWLATFNGRNKKKLGYWGMYKKHGTTFGLSSERSLATSAG